MTAMLTTVEAQKDASMRALVGSTLVGLCPPLASGLALVYPVYALTAYQLPADHPDNPLSQPLDIEQGSWFASIMQLCSMCGLVSGGLLSDRFGRKRTLVASNAILLAGWVVMFFAKSFPTLLLGRGISGLGSGINLSSSFLLLNEITLIRLRGAYGNLITLIVNVGFLLGLMFGGLAPFKWCIPLCSLPCLFFLLTCYFMPESPLWLVKKGFEEDARQSIRHLRGPNYQPSCEMKELIMCTLVAHPTVIPRVEGGGIIKRRMSRAKITVESKLSTMTSPNVWKPQLLVGVLLLFQGYSGADSISMYSIYIFKKSNVALNEYVLSVLLQAGFTVGYLVSAPIMGHVGRRSQYFASSIFMATSMLLLAGALRALDLGNPEYEHIAQIVLPFSVVSGSFAYGIGVGPVLYTVNAELFPPSVKGICSSLSLVLRDLGSFSALKTFPALETRFGLHTMFFCHGLIIMTSCVVVYLFLPETRGLTLTELLDIWSPKKKVLAVGDVEDNVGQEKVMDKGGGEGEGGDSVEGKDEKKQENEKSPMIV